MCVCVTYVYNVHASMLEFQRKSRAQEIFSTHLAPNASEPVNVDSRALTAVKERIEQDESPSVDLFDVPQMQVQYNSLFGKSIAYN